jgi:uncharacterized lipoprotein NlpE involved in copper resistance
MKKTVFVLIVILLVNGMSACKSNEKKEPATPSQENWLGTYTGILPCADCPGIRTQVTLFADSTYEVNRQYIDREEVYSQAGGFYWNESDSVIVLNDSGEAPSCYKTGENTLTQLDLNGDVITGELAENYVLRKQ